MFCTLVPALISALGGTVKLAAFARERGLRLPEGLRSAYASPPPELDGLMYGAEVVGPSGESPDFEWALELSNQSQWPIPKNLIPILPVDEKSFACVVASDLAGDPLPGEGAVVRWHLDVDDELHQAALLDTDPHAYITSYAEELRSRQIGLDRVLNEIGPAYEVNYLGAERRPRDFVVRPVRIACQNVIVALGAFTHDATIDGMAVVAWQTCEVPHVAAHEGSRALAALMLCDAFQSGGTMEIRFDRPASVVASGTSGESGNPVEVNARYKGHPEGRVPASLRRFSRTLGIELGKADPSSISPSEARDLFLAVTPMPEQLRHRVMDAVERGISSPERLCFALLSSSMWKEIELDFMLAISNRTASILRGGAPWQNRFARQSESNIARTALMVGMFFRRLVGTDGAGDAGGEARVLEDSRHSSHWEVLPAIAGVIYRNTPQGPIPWVTSSLAPPELVKAGELIVLPRTKIDSETLDLVRRLAEAQMVGIMIPKGAPRLRDELVPEGVIILECPEREAQLDIQIERKLLVARTARQ